MKKNLKTKLAALALSLTTLTNLSSCEKVEKSKEVSQDIKGIMDVIEEATKNKTETTPIVNETTTQTTQTTTHTTTPTTTQTTISSSTRIESTKTSVSNQTTSSVSNQTTSSVPSQTTATSKTEIKKEQSLTQTTPTQTTQTSTQTTEVVRKKMDQNYFRYNDMQDVETLLDSTKITNLSEFIEEKMNVNLSEEQKERYDTLIEKTINRAKECQNAYIEGNIEEFEKIYDDITNNKEYICLDDIIEIYSIAVNKYYGENIINNPKNYVIGDNSITIDGIKITNMLPKKEQIDFLDTFSLINYYYKDQQEMCDKQTIEKTNSLYTKIFLPLLINNIRIGRDINTDEIYSYTDNSMINLMNKKEDEIKKELNIESWNYDNKSDSFIVYDKENNINIYNNNSDIYEILNNYKKINEFVEHSQNITYIRIDYKEYSNILNNWLDELNKEKTK